MTHRRFASSLVVALSLSAPVAAQREVQKLLALDGQAWDTFGASVAVSEGRALVGQPGLSHLDTGLVYAFRREPSGWIQVQALPSSDTAAGDGFGFSAAMSGTTAVVGAAFHDHGGIGGTGGVYVLRFDRGSWHVVQELHGPDPIASGHIGWSVAIDGDVLVASMSSYSAGGIFRTGLACVFERRPNAWIRTAELVPTDVESDDAFGTDVAVSGTRIVVGMSKDDGLRGAAYVFEKTPQGWSRRPSSRPATERRSTTSVGRSTSRATACSSALSAPIRSARPICSSARAPAGSSA